MDQVKIGKFIAEQRKSIGLTQTQLAQKLGITDRAVSKWETGRAMPDSAIMMELCGVLGISVNDLLCGALDIPSAEAFGEGNIGRVGMLNAEMTAKNFAEAVKKALGAPFVLCGDAGLPVRRVAVVGGSGKSEISAAIKAGADTFLSGRLSYETVNEAKEKGINLLEAGHFYTEALLPKHWACELLPELGVEAEYFDTCRIDAI